MAQAAACPAPVIPLVQSATSATAQEYVSAKRELTGPNATNATRVSSTSATLAAGHASATTALVTATHNPACVSTVKATPRDPTVRNVSPDSTVAPKLPQPRPVPHVPAPTSAPQAPATPILLASCCATTASLGIQVLTVTAAAPPSSNRLVSAYRAIAAITPTPGAHWSFATPTPDSACSVGKARRGRTASIAHLGSSGMHGHTTAPGPLHGSLQHQHPPPQLSPPNLRPLTPPL